MHVYMNMTWLPCCPNWVFGNHCSCQGLDPYFQPAKQYFYKCLQYCTKKIKAPNCNESKNVTFPTWLLQEINLSIQIDAFMVKILRCFEILKDLKGPHSTCILNRHWLSLWSYKDPRKKSFKILLKRSLKILFKIL